MSTTNAAVLNTAAGSNVKIGSTTGVNGNITSACSFDNGTNWTFDGTGAQATGTFLPATVNDLTINNSGGNVTLMNAALTVNGTLGLTSGDLVTGANTVTQVGASSGNTDVVGNVVRNSPGVAALYGNPNNQIAVSGGTAPTSIKVVLAKNAAHDHAAVPDGGQARHNIAPTSGSGYTATLRLHYLDGELNGNSESVLDLWHLESGTWVDRGQTNRDSVNNWVELSGVTDAAPTGLGGDWALASPPSASLTVIKHVVNDNGGTAVASGWTLAVNSSNGGTGTGSAAGTNRGDGLHTAGWQAIQRYRERWPERVLASRARVTARSRAQSRCQLHLHDHQRRHAGDADGHQACDQRQRRHEDRGGFLDDGDRHQRVAVSDLPRRRIAGHDGDAECRAATSVDEAADAGYTKTTRCQLLRHHRGRRDQDLHDHQRRQAGDADRHQARDQRQRRHQDRGADFSMTVTGTNVQPAATFAGAESPGTTVTLIAGTYSVDEAADAGYTKTLGANCSGTIANGETKTCTITNDDKPATLIVIKHVINDNGGTKTAARLLDDGHRHQRPARSDLRRRRVAGHDGDA